MAGGLFAPRYFAPRYFPPVWFAPADESHLTPAETYRRPEPPSVSGADGAVRSASKKAKGKGKATAKPILQLYQPLPEDQLKRKIQEEDEEVISLVSLLISSGTIT